MTMPLDSFNTTLDLGELGDCEADISFYYQIGGPGRRYLWNGDPGYPEEPDELEILSVTVQIGDVKLDVLPHLSEGTLDLLVEEIENQPADPF
jgi:hypothetical protein